MLDRSPVLWWYLRNLPDPEEFIGKVFTVFVSNEPLKGFPSEDSRVDPQGEYAGYGVIGIPLFTLVTDTAVPVGHEIPHALGSVHEKDSPWAKKSSINYRDSSPQNIMNPPPLFAYPLDRFVLSNRNRQLLGWPLAVPNTPIS